jgi:hypothetical protein
MNLKEFREKTLGTVVQLVPRPLINGKPMKNEHNKWLPASEVEKDVFLFQHVETDHEVRLSKEHFKGFCAPNIMILRGQVLFEKGTTGTFEPFAPSLVTDEQLESLTVAPVFALQRGYGDRESAIFGQNDLSNKLGEYQIIESIRHCVQARSWLGILIEPLGDQPISIDIAAKATGTIYQAGSEPYEKFTFPFQMRTMLDSLLIYSEENESRLLYRYLKIDKAGRLEYADTKNACIQSKGLKIFNFVDIIGLSWQLIFMAKSLLLEAGYNSTIRFTFSMVGTRESILGSFSPGWRDPLLDPFGREHIDNRSRCADVNIKIERDIALEKLTSETSVGILKSIAGEVELAYNHQEPPRCFNPETDEFPWTQYSQSIRP